MFHSLVPFVFYFSILLTIAFFGSFLDSISAFNCPPITAVAFQKQKKQLHTYMHIYQSTFSSLSTSASSSTTLLQANTEYIPTFSGEMMFLTAEATNINTKLPTQYERSKTRESLIDLWLLPFGMSKWMWDGYADAAIRAEEKVYAAIPHFLRLHSKDIIESVNVVLYTLGSHPKLMSPDQLRDGYESIRVGIIKTKIDKDDDDSTIALAALDACRETEELFLEERTKWIQLSDMYDNHYHSNNNNNSNNNTE